MSLIVTILGVLLGNIGLVDIVAVGVNNLVVSALDGSFVMVQMLMLMLVRVVQHKIWIRGNILL